MKKANARLFLLAGTATVTALTGTVLQSSAQTATTRQTATAHHTTAAAHRPVSRSECVTVPEISPKVPALPPGSPCPKSMITVSEKVELSPLMGPTLRQSFSNLDTSFTLAYVDTRVGTGPLAQPHMYYTVQYTGYLTDGTKFDSSLDHGDKKTLSFPYGAHRVIPGWDLGFEGMRLGGKRRLFVPWQLAYGERGRPPVIPGKAELIFDMELISQSPTDPDAPPAAPPTPPTPPAGPGSPSASPILGNPPTVKLSPNSQPSAPLTAQPAPTARPQTGPDTKPAPSSTGEPGPATTTPPTAKQPPQVTPQPQ